MQRATNSTFTIESLSSLNRSSESQALPSHSELYQHLGVRLLTGVYSKQRIVEIGDQLIALAEQAYGRRDGERILELSQALLALPLPDSYRIAARYFQALGFRRVGEIEKGDLALERIASAPAHRYTARALQSFGSVLQDRGDHESALKLYLDAGRRAAETGRVECLIIHFFTQWNISGINSLKGDHSKALAQLESLSPFVRAIGPIYPQTYYDYLNNLAVECGNVGRLEQAAHACRIALSSPFAAAYPEWHETSDEIKSKLQHASRSVVAVGKHDLIVDVGNNQNIVHLPVSERAPIEIVGEHPQGVPARVLNFQQWKTTIRASSRATPDGLPADQRDRMTTGEKLIRLMDLISQDETDDDTIDRILESVEQIVLNCRSRN
jgi:tetratricopeptide (TPR) repeat protein